MKTVFNEKSIYERSAQLLTLLCFVLIAALFVISLFNTVVYMEDPNFGQYAVSESDSGFFNIILLTVMACSSYLVYRMCERINIKLMTALMVLWVLVLGVLFVYSASRAPEGDAEIIANSAYLAANGNLTALADYLSQHPFNLGLAFYEELIFRFLKIGIPDIAKGYSFMALELVNVILLAAGYYALVKLCGILFESENIQKQLILFLVLFVPAIFCCSGINGRIPAMSISVFGMWAFLLFVNNKRLVFAFASAVCLGISLALKLDAVIVFAAITFVWFFWALRHKSAKNFACLALFLLLSSAVAMLPTALMSRRTEDGAADENISLRAALGFDETERGSLIYSGMYSSVSSAISGRGSAAKDSGEDSNKLNSFYLQWNEPEFNSVLSNKNSRHYRETGRFYEMVCDSEILGVFLNLYQSFILGGAAIALIAVLKERDMLKLLLCLVFAGGALLHMVFPAQSQYAMKYYVLLMPVAAYGYCQFFEYFWIRPDEKSEK